MNNEERKNMKWKVPQHTDQKTTIESLVEDLIITTDDLKEIIKTSNDLKDRVYYIIRALEHEFNLK